MTKLNLLPVPRRCEYGAGSWDVPREAVITAAPDRRDELEWAVKRLEDRLSGTGGAGRLLLTAKETGDIRFIQTAGLPDEGYRLSVTPAGARIFYTRPAGAFYAVSTLRQLLMQGRRLPCVEIEDSPDFAVRGLMVDISRDKIPTPATLRQIAGLMADLKMNHLELYIEGFPFAYPSFPGVWAGGDPLTGEELLELSRLCKKLFIDLVPNQNSFGHMTPWLMRGEFRPLAECPDGCDGAPWGACPTPLSLNPTDPRTLDFLAATYDDLLPYFDSDFFNVGCDETFDLGLGKSRAQCEKEGVGQVYLRHLQNIGRLCAERGKTMLFWGDILVHYPELIPQLPKNAVALEWGYDADQPVEEECEKFEHSGVPYYVCPGTNTWNSITGRTDVMLTNLKNAALRGQAHGASGYLLTDWGDGGHWQPLCASYAGYCAGAALAWGVQNNLEPDLAACLDTLVFEDPTHTMGAFALRAGNYTALEQPCPQYNGTGIFRTLYYDMLDSSNTFLSFLHVPVLTEHDFSSVLTEVGALTPLLRRAEPRCADAELVLAEYDTALRLVAHGARLGLYKLEQNSLTASEKRARLRAMSDDLAAILADYRRDWLRRNRFSGLDASVQKLVQLRGQYETALAELG